MRPQDLLDAIMLALIPMLLVVANLSTRDFNKLHEQRAKAIFENRMFRADALSKQMTVELYCFLSSAVMLGIAIFYFYRRSIG